MGLFNKKLKNELKNVKEQLERSEAYAAGYKHAMERNERILNHLKESEFIRSFTMITFDGKWHRQISEADQIVYEKSTMDSALKNASINQISTIEWCKMVIINPTGAPLSASLIDMIEKSFSECGLKAIVLPAGCDIDYIC